VLWAKVIFFIDNRIPNKKNHPEIIVLVVFPMH